VGGGGRVIYPSTPPLYLWGTPSPLPYPPLYRGFLSQKGGIIPSKKFWKKIYGNMTPLYKRWGKSKK